MKKLEGWLRRWCNRSKWSGQQQQLNHRQVTTSVVMSVAGSRRVIAITWSLVSQTVFFLRLTFSSWYLVPYSSLPPSFHLSMDWSWKWSFMITNQRLQVKRPKYQKYSKLPMQFQLCHQTWHVNRMEVLLEEMWSRDRNQPLQWLLLVGCLISLLILLYSSLFFTPLKLLTGLFPLDLFFHL